jgi:hypothetical protein
MLIVVLIQLQINTILYYCEPMTIVNNKRDIPRYGNKEKVFSGFHKPLSNLKLTLKLSGSGKYEKSILAEIRKMVESSK